MTTSVVLTTYNNANDLEDLASALLAQTRRPDEVVIVDGGPMNGAGVFVELEKKLRPIPLRWRIEPTCNIQHTKSPVARGRNLAAKLSKGNLLLFTNADCRPHPGWVEAYVLAASNTGAKWLGGPVVSQPRTKTGEEIGRRILPPPESLALRRPSARSMAVEREMFFRLGGFPEKYLTAEDTLFNARVPWNVPYAFVHGAVVFYSPPDTLAELWVKGYRYSKGDALCGLNAMMHLRISLKYILGALCAGYLLS